jgi:hypothetical protein
MSEAKGTGAGAAGAGAAGAGAAGAGAAGAAPTIHDLGYKRYEGPRTPHRRRYLTVMRLTLKQSLKWWLWVTLVFAVAQVAIFGVIMYFLGRAAAIPDAGLAMDMLKPDALVWRLLTQWYGVIPLCFVVGLFAGGSAIADDARTGAFQFYFSRPVSKEHYLLGKLLAVCGLTCLLAVAPAVLLCLVRAATAPPSQLPAAGLMLLRSVGLGLVVGLTLGIPVVALSSLSTSRGVVQGGWAAVFMLSWIVGGIVSSVTVSPWPELISIPANLQVLAAYVFGLPPPDKLPWWACAIVLGAILAGSAALLRWRLRSVESIQVSS